MILNSENPHGGDIYKNTVRMDFSANVNPLGTPQAVKEAVIASLDSISKYPNPYCSELRKAIADKEQTQTDFILCGNGAAELIYSFGAALCPKKVMIAAPTFCEYEDSLRLKDTKIEYFLLTKEDNFQLTDKIFEKLDSSLQAIYLCNPNNPTGLVVPHQLLIQILNKCKENNIRFFVDECFLEWTTEDSMVSYIKDYPNLIVLKAFTKSYGMAGLRLGYVICSDKEFLNRMAMTVQVWNVSSPAQAAGIAALASTDFFEKAKNLVERERDYLINELRVLSFYVYDSQANYIFFTSGKCDAEKDGTQSEDIDIHKVLLEHGILIRDCSNYKGLEKGYYRIAVRTHEENTAFIKQLKEIVWQK